MDQTVNLTALPSMVQIHPSPPFESFFKCEMIDVLTICHEKHWFGFVAKMFSNDHNPPHFHVESLDGKKIAKIEITENAPKIFDDLKILKILNQKEFDKIKKNLLKWCNSERNGVKIWQYAKLVWDDYHTDDTAFE